MSVKKIEVGKWYKVRSTGDVLRCYKLSGGGDFGYFSKGNVDWGEGVFFPCELQTTMPKSDNLSAILSKYSKRKLSVALGHHHSYLSRLMKKEISDSKFNNLMQRLTIDWNSTKPYKVNDGKHVPYTIRPASYVKEKHKQWFTELFFSGAVAL